MPTSSPVTAPSHYPPQGPAVSSSGPPSKVPLVLTPTSKPHTDNCNDKPHASKIAHAPVMAPRTTRPKSAAPTRTPSSEPIRPANPERSPRQETSGPTAIPSYKPISHPTDAHSVVASPNPTREAQQGQPTMSPRIKATQLPIRQPTPAPQDQLSPNPSRRPVEIITPTFLPTNTETIMIDTSAPTAVPASHPRKKGTSPNVKGTSNPILSPPLKRNPCPTGHCYDIAKPKCVPGSNSTCDYHINGDSPFPSRKLHRAPDKFDDQVESNAGGSRTGQPDNENIVSTKLSDDMNQDA